MFVVAEDPRELDIGTCDRCTDTQVPRTRYQYEVVLDRRTLVLFDRLCHKCLKIAVDKQREGMLD